MPWYGELPERWETRIIKNLFHIQKSIAGAEGYNVLSITQGGIRVKDIESNQGQMAQSYAKYQFVNIGDFAMNHMDLLTGWVDYAKVFGVTSPDYRVFVLDDKTQNSDYLLKVLQLCYSQRIFYALGHGAAQEGRWRLPRKEFLNFSLPLPPRDEQDQIVRYLDWKVSQINKLINAKRQQIALLQEQKRAMINEAVTRGGEGWQDISLGNLGSFRKGFGGSRSDDTDDGVACIRYGDIYRTGALSLTKPITRISKQAAVSYSRVYKSEMLFALSGETKEEIGQALVNNINEDTWCSGDAAIFTVNSFILPHFLMYVLRCPYIVAQRASLAKGDIIVHISTGALRQLRILVPPISEQKKIITELECKCLAIDKAITITNDQIPLLHEYRTRLVSDVVTGKLDVRGIVVPEYEDLGDAAENIEEFDDELGKTEGIS